MGARRTHPGPPPCHGLQGERGKRVGIRVPEERSETQAASAALTRQCEPAEFPQNQGREGALLLSDVPTQQWAPQGDAQDGAVELVTKGPLVPTLPFPLHMPRKTHNCLGALMHEVPASWPPTEDSQPSQKLPCRSHQPQKFCRPPATGSLWSSALRRGRSKPGQRHPP